MDRFALRLSLGYVSIDDEIEIMTVNNRSLPVDEIENCVGVEDVLAFQRTAADVPISDELKRYLVTLVAATRDAEQIELGASPRASIAMLKCAQALALFDGIDFVTPDLIQELAPLVLSHRLALRAEARFSGAASATLIAELLAATPVPR